MMMVVINVAISSPRLRVLKDCKKTLAWYIQNAPSYNYDKDPDFDKSVLLLFETPSHSTPVNIAAVAGRSSG